MCKIIMTKLFYEKQIIVKNKDIFDFILNRITRTYKNLYLGVNYSRNKDYSFGLLARPHNALSFGFTNSSNNIVATKDPANTIGLFLNQKESLRTLN